MNYSCCYFSILSTFYSNLSVKESIVVKDYAIYYIIYLYPRLDISFILNIYINYCTFVDDALFTTDEPGSANYELYCYFNYSDFTLINSY